MKTVITEINEFFMLSGLITEQATLFKQLFSKIGVDDVIKATRPNVDDVAKNRIRNLMSDIASISGDDLFFIIKNLEPEKTAKLFFDNGVIFSKNSLKNSYDRLIQKIESGEATFDEVIESWRKSGRENFFGRVSGEVDDELIKIADAYVDNLSDDFASYAKIKNPKIKIPFLNLSAKQRRSLLIREFSSIWNSPGLISVIWKFRGQLANGRKGWKVFLTWLFSGQTRSITKGWRELLEVFKKEGFSRPIIDFVLMKTGALGVSVMIRYLKLNALIFTINLIYAYMKEVNTVITDERERRTFSENLFEDIKTLWPSLPISYFLPFIYVGAEIKKLITDVTDRVDYWPIFLEKLKERYSEEVESIESDVNYKVKLREFKAKLRVKYPRLSRDVMNKIRYVQQDNLYFYDIYPIKKYGNDYYIINEELNKAKPLSTLQR